MNEAWRRKSELNVRETSGEQGVRTLPRGSRRITRRAFLGLGGAAAASLLLGSRLAWGSVGGGEWGNVGAVATPGSHFGYDGGWGYSSNGRVWIAVSCNATVGRVTELFLSVSVASYYANGGIWSPTWTTDYPDTHVDSFVRNEQAWVSSTSGFYDTTYDCAWFQGPYATHTLRVSREAWDWWAWAGVRVWCDSPDNAYGINTTAEASQLIPAHVLTDDRSWQGRIVTMSPEVALHLRLDTAGGGRENGTGLWGWQSLDTTSQNWMVLTSAQGRTCFVPVHTGNTPLFVDVASNDWNDGDDVHLWSGTGAWNQSFWLHNLGTGYHLIVPECSGCALDLVGGGQVDGTNVAQYNCYGNWNNPNQHWKLEEVVFREQEPNSLALVGASEHEGAVPGDVLAPTDPALSCIPRNYPGTLGMYYRYAWYRGAEAGARAELVQPAGEDSHYQVVEADAGSYLTCVVTAHTRYGDLSYRGEAAAPSVLVRSPQVQVRFFADSEAIPCFVDNVPRGSAYAVSSAAEDAATKSDCAGLDAWYADREYAVLYQDGTLLEEDLDLFARNQVTLTYALASRTCFDDSSRSFFLDETLSVSLPAATELLPSPTLHYHGDKATFERGASVWYEDMGKVREATCASGAYAVPDATGPLMRSARLTRNTVVYLAWRTSAYDGIALS